MRQRRRLRAALPACALSVAVLAGCSGGPGPDRSASPSPSDQSSARSSAPSASAPTGSRSPHATTTPTVLPRVRMEATTLHAAVLARSAATTPEEHAVVDAWMAYWQAATDTAYFGRPDPRLAQVSTGAARDSIVGYLRQKKAVGQRVVGWARDNVLRVSVTGGRATVHDCTENFTFSVDEEGTPATRPDPWYDVHGTLARRDGRWVVTTQSSDPLTTSCLG